jgi:hypothetical protein
MGGHRIPIVVASDAKQSSLGEELDCLVPLRGPRNDANKKGIANADALLIHNPHIKSLSR